MMEEENHLSCYNPFNAKGMGVGASVVGIIGIILAVIGVLAALTTWFNIKIDADFKFLTNRFFTGLWTLISFNLLGLMVLMVGKVYHFYNNLMDQGDSLRDQNETLIDSINKMVKEEAASQSQSFDVNQ